MGLAQLASFTGDLRAHLLRTVVKAARYGYRHGAAGLIRRVNFEIRRRSQGHDYRAWLAANLLTESDLAEQRVHAEGFAHRPLISFLTAVCDPDPAALRDTIESVLAQTYPHWELCLADGGSRRDGVREVLKFYAARDPRIRVEFLRENRGSSGNSNAALAMTRGEYTALVDQSDRVSPDMLFEVVSLLRDRPETDIVYSDEDRLTADGARRHSPNFKPHTWSPELLLSENYLRHSVVRRRLIGEVGGFDPEMDGAQDWDLLFRCAERTAHIAHVPKVLYHRRQVSAPAARDSQVVDAQRRSVASHVRRSGISGAAVSQPTDGRWRVQWEPRPATVSLIIPTRDNLRVLKRCLDSIRQRTAYDHYEIILVDSGSVEAKTHRYYRTLEADPRVRLVRAEGAFNYSAANNLGARHATGDLLLFLNNDVEALDADWLTELARWAARPEIGIVGAQLLFPNRSIQHAGVVVSLFGLCSHVCLGAPEHFFGCFGSVGSYRNFTAVTGACQMMRREVFDAVGGYDERYQLVFSDVQICLDAVQRGYRVLYTPFARLKHHEGKSRAGHIPDADLELARREMRHLIRQGDPYYNPNLSNWSHIPRVVLDRDRGQPLVSNG